MLEKAVSGVVFLLALVAVVVMVRTFMLAPRSITGPPCKPIDTDFISASPKLVDNFRQALRFQTISRDHGDYNRDELLQFQNFIKTTYPTVHSSPLVRHEVVANYSLLYTVKGTDMALKPFMLTGHLDVVPALPAEWDVPPFEGQLRNGFIYGRGTIDDKHTVMGILEALEFLLKSGHKPQRGFYVAFGHDEEVNGLDGAAAIGRLLEDRGVELEFLVDEGLTILSGVIDGMSKPVALVGTSEKGFVTLKLSVNMPGGHSSMPGPESSIGVLARAVSRLENNPHPSMFGTGPEAGMMEHLAPEMWFPFRVLMSNLWLFSPLVSRVMSRKPESNAVVRTTTAVTEFHAGIKSNVIAPSATATVNHRIHPAQTVQEVVEYDRRVIGDDRVKVEVAHAMAPLPKSPYGDDEFGWHTIKTSILQVWGYADVVVAPGVMIGNTDTRHYTNLTQNLYRFGPTFMYREDLARFHGKNERISVKNYEQAVNFFYHLLVNADKGDLVPLHHHTDF